MTFLCNLVGWTKTEQRFLRKPLGKKPQWTVVILRPFTLTPCVLQRGDGAIEGWSRTKDQRLFLHNGYPERIVAMASLLRRLGCGPGRHLFERAHGLARRIHGDGDHRKRNLVADPTGPR